MKTLGEQWPRLVELSLAVWLAAGPWLLGGPAVLRVHDGIAAVIIVAITLWSMARPARRFNLYNLAPGVWLTLMPLVWSRSIHSPTAQSEMLVGITLAMFAIIPGRTMDPPANWERFFEQHPDAAEAEREAVARYGRRASGSNPHHKPSKQESHA